jgi:cytochrome c553
MRHGGRGSTGNWNPMLAEAHALGDGDIAALAAYYSTQAPTKGGAQTASATWPTGDLGRGKLLFQTVCTKCHLNDGRGDTEGLLPNITLQGTPYLLQTLHAFRAEVRQSTKMRETTQDLSFADIASVANYLNSLPPENAVEKVSSTGDGAGIAKDGDSHRGIPACLGCHGEKGIGELPLIPRLQGQSQAYLKARLDLFAAAREGDITALNPMPVIASKLTSDERTNLAAYFASQAPIPKDAGQ